MILWDTRQQKLLQHYRAHSAPVASVAFHPSGNYLVSASDDKTIRVWDLREGRLLWSLLSHTGAVNSVSFAEDSPDWFVSGGAICSCKSANLFFLGSDSVVLVWKASFDSEAQ